VFDGLHKIDSPDAQLPYKIFLLSHSYTVLPRACGQRVRYGQVKRHTPALTCTVERDGTVDHPMYGITDGSELFVVSE